MEIIDPIIEQAVYDCEANFPDNPEFKDFVKERMTYLARSFLLEMEAIKRENRDQINKMSASY